MNALRVTLVRAVVLALVLMSGARGWSQDPKLLVHWDFNDAGDPNRVVDVVHGIPGTFIKGAAYTSDAGGRSGAPGDRAVDMGTTSAGQAVIVKQLSYLNAATALDQISVSFWVKHHSVAPSSGFWMNAPSSGGGRGFNVHVPWDNNNIYYDTGGCCNGDTRISASINTFANYSGDPSWFGDWHHYVFVKDVAVKQIWIDGVLFLEGTGTMPLPTDINELFIGSDNSGAGSIKGLIDDFAIFGAPLTEAQIGELAAGSSPSSLIVDSDLDGIPDWWEELYGLNPSVNDAASDPDADGLTNLQEYRKLTDPNNGDTDGDGLKDGVETGTGVYVSALNTGTDPLAADSDGDGLADGVETATGHYTSVADTGSNPNNPDTDGDLYSDGLEVNFGGNPVDASKIPITPGKANLIAWWDFNDTSDPAVARDRIHGIEGLLSKGALYSGDGLGHSGVSGDSAADLGTDGAGEFIDVADGSFVNVGAVGDAVTVSFWQQLTSIAASSAFYMTSPSSSTGGRGFQAHAPWSDSTIYYDTAGCCASESRYAVNISSLVGSSDTWVTSWHHFAFVKNGGTKQIWIDGKLVGATSGAAPLPRDFAQLAIGAGAGGSQSIKGLIDDFAVYASALDDSRIKALAAGTPPDEVDQLADSDGDGMPDVWEIANGLDPAVNDAAADPDGDGLTNLQEFKHKTDPHSGDSDGDGLSDKVETATGVFVSGTDTGTDPNLADTDGDGLSDLVETGTGVYVSPTITGSNPNQKDTDGDGFADGVEVTLGSSPVNASSRPIQPGQPNLIVFWDFNDASQPDVTLDRVHGIPGAVLNGAVFAGDSMGHTGTSGDDAMDFGSGGGHTVRVDDARFLNVASPGDAMTVSVWVQLHEVAASSAFWLETVSGDGRGFQAHVTWSDQVIYYDTSGCCGPAQRIAANIGTFPNYSGDVSWLSEWHHYVFVKNGAVKQVWIDGALFLGGANAAPLFSDFIHLYIGSDNNSANSIHGLVDDFAIFGSALTPSQISALTGGVSPLDLQASPTLSITPGVGKVTLSWTGTLQSADSLEGPWADVLNATSPADISTTEAHRFYRSSK